MDDLTERGRAEERLGYLAGLSDHTGRRNHRPGRRVVRHGIDELLFHEAADAVGTSDPGRMAPNTAVAFLLR